MKAMREKLLNQIDNSPRLKKYQAQLKIDVTDEGLRVLITDEANRPMFANASAEMQPYAQEIIKAMALTFNDMPNTISVSGHTDGMPYANNNGTYTNWELSADRANAARRVLLAGGLKQDHLLRVTGLADAVLLDPKDPVNPINRRISIILLNKAAEAAVRNEGKLKTTTIDTYLDNGDPRKITPTPPAIAIIPSVKPTLPAPTITPETPKAVEKIEPPPIAPTPPKSKVEPSIPPSPPPRVENTPKSQAFQAIQKPQIIQLDKPVPSKN